MARRRPRRDDGYVEEPAGWLPPWETARAAGGSGAPGGEGSGRPPGNGSGPRPGYDAGPPPGNGSGAPPGAGSRDPQQPPWHFRRHGPGRWTRGAGPLRRAREDRLIGGVAAAIAGRIGRDVTIIRIVLAVLTFVGGAGVPIYLACWLLIPEEGSDQSIASSFVQSRQTRSL